MKGVGIYSKQICCFLLDGLVPFINTGYDIHNVKTLTTAIKIKNENTSDSMSTISYHVG